MRYQHARYGRLRAAFCTLIAAIVVWLIVPAPSFADWREDAKNAVIKYADDKKNEVVKDQAKAAVFALYKKLYAAKGVSRAFSRKLAEVAISAPDLNKLAEETAEAYGSGDPDKIREASEKVAVKFGEQLSKLASTPELRGQLGSIIGSADKVKEISTMLGNVAAGTDSSRRAAAEYVGQALINLTPGAGVVGFYQAAYGAMKYANNEYVDSKIEDLYQAYKKGDAAARELLLDQLRAGTGGYGYVIENRRKELENEKTAAIGDAAGAASERVREHLTKTSSDDVIGNILASFDGRIEKERKDAVQKAEREKAQKEAEAIFAELDQVSSQRHGADWYDKRPVNLDKFADIVREQIKADGVLDPNDPAHVKKMSELLSTAMAYGRNSKEYAELLAEIAEIKNGVLALNKGAPCLDGSPTQRLAISLWQKGKALIAAGKPAAALPVLRQSLEYCPDDDRAAQLAELAKAAVPDGFDGTYSGSVAFGPKEQRNLKGTIQLTVAGDRVIGALTSRQAHPKGVVTRQAAFSGSVSKDGRISGTISGSSRFSATAPDADISEMLNTYTFEGSLSGRIAGKAATGSFYAENPRAMVKSYMTGAWNAARR